MAHRALSPIWAALTMLVLATVAVAVLVIHEPAQHSAWTNRELAARIDALGSRQVQPGDVPEVLGFACPGPHSDPSGYDPRLVALVLASGRCGR